MQARILTALLITGLLTACASTTMPPAKIPSAPYWENPQWINAMGQAIQDNIQYPIEAAKNGFPSGRAVVQFTYADDQFQDVSIIKSTGNKILDATIETQIPKIKPPVVAGSTASVPHRFQLTVNIAPYSYSFIREVHDDLRKYARYPRIAILSGQQGIVVAHFQYLNGTVLNPSIEKSSKWPALDKAVLDELLHIKLPLPPSWALDKKLGFRVPICFSLGRTPSCAGIVTEVRYVPSGTTTTTTTTTHQPCADIGFDYQNGKISNVRLIHSSGDVDIDKDALSRISRGDFPPPPENQKDQASNFEIPVCYSNKQPPPTAASAHPGTSR